MTAAKTAGPSVGLKHFVWEKASKTMSAFASDMGPAYAGQWWLVQLYPDSCDLGMSVFSEKTGRTETFLLAEREERDGDILAWRFVPLSSVPGIKSVIVFND